ncbi:hypothetical protein DAPPUDRAFT_248573 [Daphnia pulex]|uniref:Uncharacterized protein n=1 Tax=Daphnia pulex TaxID=6669 RepID=E9GUF0_DAPPU|nr:hypothetical protein DAPPUDRAFT_248573 [Daphnia pulex]|eukprot:EFX76859.1 hypothetical protein DAPPUDRAFT_248573 [Daphnia pulex]
MLNKLGHCVSSYNVAQELETELTVAYDNSDRYIETLTGKDTLHDIGIVYQDDTECFSPNRNVDQDKEGEDQPVGAGTSGRPSILRRRDFLEAMEVLEPYTKRPRLVQEDMTPVADPRREEIPSTFNVENCWTLFGCHL